MRTLSNTFQFLHTKMNSLGFFCVLSIILLKIQIVTDVSGALQLPDFFFFNVPYKESVKYKLEDSFILWWMRVNTHCSHHVALLCEHGIYCGVCPLKCHLWLIYRHGNHNFQLFCWGLCTDFIWRRCACLGNKNFIPLRNCWMWMCWCRSLYQGHLIVYKKK